MMLRKLHEVRIKTRRFSAIGQTERINIVERLVCLKHWERALKRAVEELLKQAVYVCASKVW